MFLLMSDVGKNLLFLWFIFGFSIFYLGFSPISLPWWRQYCVFFGFDYCRYIIENRGCAYDAKFPRRVTFLHCCIYMWCDVIFEMYRTCSSKYYYGIKRDLSGNKKSSGIFFIITNYITDRQVNANWEYYKTEKDISIDSNTRR